MKPFAVNENADYNFSSLYLSAKNVIQLYLKFSYFRSNKKKLIQRLMHTIKRNASSLDIIKESDN
jgi:hypothetical protein